MSELTLLVLQLGFLLLLWVFVFSIVYALRSDLFGQRVRKFPDAATAAAAPAPAPAAAAAPSAFPSSQVSSAPTEAVNQPPVASDHASTDNATRLVITSGAKSGAEFPLGRDEITIGRSSDSAIIIRDDYTSTHHARLMLWNGRWMIQDLDSTNGTFLDGSRVTVPTPVPLGATVKVGATTFELRR
ncbi:FHA domain-containing protein FhaB/FipA [Agromyces aerolatus]|uniref:FHA domain-containing protein FhaB/FipA n=1 Tax=Agromyces sp. LY-1074 TaxID=3074080 RepID=UPI00285B01A0|nr:MULTISPECIES: FHA domain-containing protein [unclassified Agromyces]MDR5699263.1 FHA domain-containing protein [Agromyces sp. LY-1074]MDR5705559.1 FHA domain-containing protein [Agromyces sp. LY-1358]